LIYSKFVASATGIEQKVSAFSVLCFMTWWRQPITHGALYAALCIAGPACPWNTPRITLRRRPSYSDFSYWNAHQI